MEEEEEEDQEEEEEENRQKKGLRTTSHRTFYHTWRIVVRCLFLEVRNRHLATILPMVLEEGGVWSSEVKCLKVKKMITFITFPTVVLIQLDVIGGREGR